jgi:hypothetical protein
MSAAISSLLGALVGGLAAIGGAWVQARNTATLEREEAVRQEKRRHTEKAELLQERQRLLARRYLYQLGDAWTRYGTGLTTGRTAVGLNILKGYIQITGR